MREINVIEIEENEKFSLYEVKIKENWTRSTHRVYVEGEEYQRLTDKKVSKKDFVKKCFEFLLSRESKESILQEFNTRDIGYYFPDFEISVLKLLNA